MDPCTGSATGSLLVFGVEGCFSQKPGTHGLSTFSSGLESRFANFW